jgi:hypothetical protein
MCSTGSEGRITISREAYLRVMDTKFLFFEFEVEAKGKGILKVYRVMKRIFQANKMRKYSLPGKLEAASRRITSISL